MQIPCLGQNRVPFCLQQNYAPRLKNTCPAHPVTYWPTNSLEGFWTTSLEVAKGCPELLTRVCRVPYDDGAYAVPTDAWTTRFSADSSVTLSIRSNRATQFIPAVYVTRHSNVAPTKTFGEPYTLPMCFEPNTTLLVLLKLLPYDTSVKPPPHTVLLFLKTIFYIEANSVTNSVYTRWFLRWTRKA